jgi:hypothetical protein
MENGARHMRSILPNDNQAFMQSRRNSLVEAAANTAAGFGVSWLTGLIAYPLLGLHVSQAQNVALIGIFTVASLIRGYAARRLFNRIFLKKL